MSQVPGVGQEWAHISERNVSNLNFNFFIDVYAHTYIYIYAYVPYYRAVRSEDIYVKIDLKSLHLGVKLGRYPMVWKCLESSDGVELAPTTGTRRPATKGL